VLGSSETPAKCPRSTPRRVNFQTLRGTRPGTFGHGASGHLNLRWRRRRSEGCHTLVGLSARSCRLHSGGVQAHEPTGRYSPSSIASVSSASRDETTQGTREVASRGFANRPSFTHAADAAAPGLGLIAPGTDGRRAPDRCLPGRDALGAGLHGRRRSWPRPAPHASEQPPPPATYTVTVCILAPSAGATGHGFEGRDRDAERERTSPGFQRATFTLDARRCSRTTSRRTRSSSILGGGVTGRTRSR